MINYYLGGMFTVIFAVIAIYLDAYSDAKLDAIGRRKHVHEALAILALFVMLIWPGIYHKGDLTNISEMLCYGGKLVLGYTLLRIGIFNSIYNSVRSINLNYIGTTDPILDYFLSKIPLKYSMGLHLLIALLCTFGGIITLLNL